MLRPPRENPCLYLVESLIASQLQRNFGNRIFYWRNGQEIDFVVFREEQRAALIEVKYQNKINPENAVRHALCAMLLLQHRDLCC